MKILFAIGLLAALPLAASAQQPAGVPHPGTEHPASCAPSMGLHYVCGLDEPEDLLQVANSKWVIASGMGEHGGIFLIDTEAKSARRFFTGASKPDLKMYPDCASPPANFNAHGIALRPGRTAAIGRIAGRPVIALPGAPDQALAAWWTLALPVLDRLSGREKRATTTLPLARKIASSVGIAEIVLLEKVDDAWMPLATGDLSFETIAHADAWLAVPGASEGYAAGTPVNAYMLRD